METVYQLDKEIESFIQSLIKHKESFKIEMTGYTITVIWDNIKYIASGEPQKDFSGHILGLNSKIKSDIKKSNLYIDKIFEEEIKWFSVNTILRKNKYHFNSDDVYNIDISSAFPTILKNYGLITEQTYKAMHFYTDKKTGEIKEMKKKHRLKSIGMLATQKIVYEYKKGKEINSELIEDEENRNIFFMLCYETGRMMSEIIKELNNDFIFFWFDGVFFTGKENIKKGTDILNKYGYKYTVEKLKQFKINSESDITAEFSFWQFDEKTISHEKKVFNIPLPYRKKSVWINEYLKKIKDGSIKY